MYRARLFFAALPFACLGAACEFNVGWANNSSQGDNDYFEEPISGRSEKYTPALDTSNAFVEYFSGGELAKARELFDPRLQANVTGEQLRSMHGQFLEVFGPLLEYKPMQWGFGAHQNKPNVLVSVKIAVHRNAEAFYVLTFEDDGIYDGIIGFKVRAKGEGERVAQAIDEELQGT